MGNPGQRPLPRSEPQPAKPRRAPRAPGHLDAAGKREWKRIARLLLDTGLYTHIDHAALEMYCAAYGRWVQAETKLRIQGPIITTDKGNLIQNPWLAVANRAMEQVRKLLAEFGMTPSSRTRVSVTGNQDTPTLAEVLFSEVDVGTR